MEYSPHIHVQEACKDDNHEGTPHPLDHSPRGQSRAVHVHIPQVREPLPAARPASSYHRPRQANCSSSRWVHACTLRSRPGRQTHIHSVESLRQRDQERVGHCADHPDTAGHLPDSSHSQNGEPRRSISYDTCALRQPHGERDCIGQMRLSTGGFPGISRLCGPRCAHFFRHGTQAPSTHGHTMIARVCLPGRRSTDPLLMHRRSRRAACGPSD